MRALALALLVVGGCHWRLAGPPTADAGLQVRVIGDAGRTPEAASFLQAAIAERVHEATGWAIRGDGARRLDLAIDGDDWAAVGHDARGIASRWRYRVTVSALLVSAEGHRAWQGSGLGYAAERAGERQALQAAADDIAQQLARWLATRRAP